MLRCHPIVDTSLNSGGRRIVPLPSLAHSLWAAEACGRRSSTSSHPWKILPKIHPVPQYLPTKVCGGEGWLWWLTPAPLYLGKGGQCWYRWSCPQGNAWVTCFENGLPVCQLGVENDCTEICLNIKNKLNEQLAICFWEFYDLMACNISIYVHNCTQHMNIRKIHVLRCAG